MIVLTPTNGLTHGIDAAGVVEAAGEICESSIRRSGLTSCTRPPANGDAISADAAGVIGAGRDGDERTVRWTGLTLFI